MYHPTKSCEFASPANKIVPDFECLSTYVNHMRFSEMKIFVDRTTLLDYVNPYLVGFCKIAQSRAILKKIQPYQKFV